MDLHPGRRSQGLEGRRGDQGGLLQPHRLTTRLFLLVAATAAPVVASGVPAWAGGNSGDNPSATATNSGTGALAVGVDAPGEGPSRAGSGRNGSGGASAVTVLYGSTCGGNGIAAGPGSGWPAPRAVGA